MAFQQPGPAKNIHLVGGHHLGVGQRLEQRRQQQAHQTRRGSPVGEGELAGQRVRIRRPKVGADLQPGEGHAGDPDVVDIEGAHFGGADKFGRVGHVLAAIGKAEEQPHVLRPQPISGARAQRRRVAARQAQLPNVVVGVVGRRQAHIGRQAQRQWVGLT